MDAAVEVLALGAALVDELLELPEDEHATSAPANATAARPHAIARITFFLFIDVLSPVSPSAQRPYDSRTAWLPFLVIIILVLVCSSIEIIQSEYQVGQDCSCVKIIITLGWTALRRAARQSNRRRRIAFVQRQDNRRHRVAFVRRLTTLTLRRMPPTKNSGQHIAACSRRRTAAGTSPYAPDNSPRPRRAPCRYRQCHSRRCYRAHRGSPHSTAPCG